MLTKKTKAGEKEIDIIPLIRSVKAEFNEDSGSIDILTTVSASSTEYLNPEMLITGLKKNAGILLGNPLCEYYSIMRTELLKENMTSFS